MSLLDTVLRDLGPALRAPVERTPEYDFDGHVAVAIGGNVFHIPYRGDDVDRLTDVADAVQDWAVEELWSRRESAVWPQCPTHPDSHPLRAQRGAWHCPTTGQRIAAIGEL